MSWLGLVFPAVLTLSIDLNHYIAMDVVNNLLGDDKNTFTNPNKHNIV
jgi:hypothetical protein